MAKIRKTKNDGTLRYLFDALVVIVILAVIFGPTLSERLFGNKNELSDTPIGEMSIHMISVGQADSFLLMTPNGNILIDAGGNSTENELSNYLDSQGVTEFEYCIFSHAHEDHIGGADMVLKNYSVKNVIMSPVSSTTKTYERLLDALEGSEANVYPAKSGDKYTLGNVDILILAPITQEDSDLNNSSVVLKVIYGEKSFIFTGDAESPVEKDILSVFSSSELDCDWLKAGHHGSSTSTSSAFLDALTPDFVAISCGKGNTFGHPHRETIEELRRRDIDYYRTDSDGTVVFICNGEEIVINKK